MIASILSSLFFLLGIYLFIGAVTVRRCLLEPARKKMRAVSSSQINQAQWWSQNGPDFADGLLYMLFWPALVSEWIVYRVGKLMSRKIGGPK